MDQGAGTDGGMVLAGADTDEVSVRCAAEMGAGAWRADALAGGDADTAA